VTSYDRLMASPSCGAEAVFVRQAGEPPPSRERLARGGAPLVDRRDLDRAVANATILLSLVGRTVIGWEPHGDLHAEQDLEWWAPKDDRTNYQALVIALEGGEEAIIASGETNEFTIVRSTMRQRATGPPTDPTGPGRPALGRIDQGACILHAHRTPPPYRQRLVLQFLLEIGGRSWVLMAAEGYDVDEWSLADDCDAVRRPVDDLWWPLP
jgi:hypothetical protein